MEPIAIVDDARHMAGRLVADAGYNHRHALCVEPGPLDAAHIARCGAELLIVAIPSLGQPRLAELAEACAEAGARLAFVPNNTSPTEAWIESTEIDGISLSFLSSPLAPPGYGWLKRLMDVPLSLLLLLAFSPLMLLLMIIIRLESPGPALFRQDRVGLNGRIFRMFKFRSMYVDTPRHEYSPRTAEDPRITRSGVWLRRSSLDELPQLLNVLAGEMSLVGPRPEMPFIVQQCYGPLENKRLAVLPGITGLWQLSADRACLIHDNIHYDLYYIRHRNVFMDIAILLHTAVFAMRGI
jgi:lipopolysaccharide/colanic/teichoic acid biosynthesis glycosyltransferase